MGQAVHRLSPQGREGPARLDLRADSVAVVHEKQPHTRILVSGLGVCAPKMTMRIRGWLLVLCALLLVWQPLNLGLTMAPLVDRLSSRGPGLAVILLLRLIGAALGIAAG